MKVLVIEPMKKPYAKNIDPGLHSLQHEVGGYIEVIYPYAEKVGLICNEEGKLDGLSLNRAIKDKDGETVDIIAGTFLIAGLGEEDFNSLNNVLLDQFSLLFQTPEEFYSVDGQIHVKQVKASIDKGINPAEAWQEEYKSTQICAKDLAENGPLSYAFHERKLGTFLNEMINKHGAQRIGLVLANTINNADMEGRYSPAVKKWASQIAPFPQPPEHQGEPRKFYELSSNAHPVILNEFAKKLIDAERQKQPVKTEQVR